MWILGKVPVLVCVVGLCVCDLRGCLLFGICVSGLYRRQFEVRALNVLFREGLTWHSSQLVSSLDLQGLFVRTHIALQWHLNCIQLNLTVSVLNLKD